MLNITALLSGDGVREGDLRYGRKAHSKPVVVWNLTKACNLRCAHCYSGSGAAEAAQGLSERQEEALIHQLADFGVPVILFSGGEPLMKKGIFALGELAHDLGIKTVLSTNGTLLTREAATRIRASNFSYVGISLDGRKETHDAFRGVAGSFDASLRGVRNSVREGIRTGLRYTLTKRNYADIEHIMRLSSEEKVDRICFYHLVYAGRGSGLVAEDLTHAESRDAMDRIMAFASDGLAAGRRTEVLTVDNHADAAYMVLRTREGGHARASDMERMLRANGGNSSGQGICGIDAYGQVHPDQFWTGQTVGDIRQKPFADIWRDDPSQLLVQLRDRRSLLSGRCRSCRFIDMCNGGLRARAETVHGDLWAPDPACYLTDEEATGGPA